jgi:hypothetical protein
MGERTGFNFVDALVSFCLAFILVLCTSACGPLAPSISKISNAGAQKSSYTDGSSQTEGSTTHNELVQVTGGSTDLKNSSREVTTQIVSEEEYKEHFASQKPVARITFDVTPEKLETLNRSEPIKFVNLELSTDDRNVRSQEKKLSRLDATVYIVSSMDSSLLKQFRENRKFDDLKFALDYSEEISKKQNSSVWYLSINVSGDPQADVQNIEHPWMDLEPTITKIAIVFQPVLKSSGK